MAEPITGDALWEFLAAGTRTAKLAYSRLDGGALVAPVWFVVDEEELVFTTMTTTARYRALCRDPLVGICVDDENYPYGFASLQGQASWQALSPDELLPWTTRIARRYVGDEKAEQFGQRNAVEGEVLVRVQVLKSFAYSGVAD